MSITPRYGYIHYKDDMDDASPSSQVISFRSNRSSNIPVAQQQNPSVNAARFPNFPLAAGRFSVFYLTPRTPIPCKVEFHKIAVVL